MVRDRLRQRPDPQREVNADVSAADHHTPWQYCRAVPSPPARQTFSQATAQPGEQAAIDHGGTVRRGQGYSLRASTIQVIHRQMLARCQPLDGGHGTPTVPAQRKARREYENASARSSRPVPRLGINPSRPATTSCTSRPACTAEDCFALPPIVNVF